MTDGRAHPGSSGGRVPWATHLGLLRWNLRRLLPAGGWLGALALGALFHAYAPGPEPPRSLGPAAPLVSAGAPGASPAAMLAAGYLWPWLLLGAARLGHRWREREADWLAPLPIRRAALSCSALASLAAAAATVALVSFVLARAEGAGALSWTRSLPHPSGALLEGDAALEFTVEDLALEDLEPGSRLVARPSVAPGSGPAVSLAFSLWGAQGAVRTTRQRIHGRSEVSLELPPGMRGAARLRLEREGPGAVLVLPRGALELREPVRDAPLAGQSLWLAMALAGCAWCVLALGLGMWMRPGLAAGLTFLLALCPIWSPRLAGQAWWPGHALAELWQAQARGLVPRAHAPLESVAPLALLGPAACVALGALLYRAGLGAGRGPR